jgi:tetratricopeptide (TPR) repeat protein
MHDEATAMVQKAIALSGDTAKLMALGRLYAAAGRTDDALKIIDELREMSKQRYISAYALGLIYAALDEIDRAFDYLEAAYAERAGDLIFLKADPWLSPLRSDPRFQDLLRRVGLPPKSLTIPA